jgi:hypothetical protein
MDKRWPVASKATTDAASAALFGSPPVVVLKLTPPGYFNFLG